jgi:hypothetical protein
VVCVLGAAAHRGHQHHHPLLALELLHRPHLTSDTTQFNQPLGEKAQSSFCYQQTILPPTFKYLARSGFFRSFSNILRPLRIFSTCYSGGKVGFYFQYAFHDTN